MKFKITLLLFLTAFYLHAQVPLGMGLVTIDFDDTTILQFYNAPGDDKPVKTIEFFDDKDINSWNIKNFNEHKKWLSPEQLWLDYQFFTFRCTEQKPGWYKVIVHNDTSKTYWLKHNPATEFVTWETFLKDKFSISMQANQKIYTKPDANAATIPYTEVRCLGVRSMKGDWVEIFTRDYCEDSAVTTQITSGWIKWREGNTLLIEYYPAS